MQHHTDAGSPTNAETFPTDRSGLPEAGRPEVVELVHGDTLHLEVGGQARWGTPPFSTSGDPDLQLSARAGEVVRLWLTNTANTRVFNLRLPGARLKLVGGDSGRVEHQEFVSEVLLARSERRSPATSLGAAPSGA